MRKIIFASVITAFAIQHTAAQDAPPTQVFTTPLKVNPAMTGLIANDVRVSANYFGSEGIPSGRRDHEMNMSVDMPMLRGVLPEGDALGVGLLHQHNSRSFGYINSATGLSVAYHKAIDKAGRHHLSLGVQGVTNNIHVKGGTASGYMPVSYWNYNAGIMYSGSVSERLAVYGSYAPYRYSAQKIHPMEDKGSWAYPRHQFNAGGSFALCNRISLFANAQYTYYVSLADLQVGGYARYLFTTPGAKTKLGEIAVYTGGWYGKHDRLSPYMAIQAGSMRVGASYRAYSEFEPTDNIELSIIYTGSPRKKSAVARNSGWHCPQIY